jgi:glycosyltransferase involved in cell wall biosynthesis
MREAITGDGALILRVPSPLAGSVAGVLKKSRRPYAVEVLGDPWDVFAPGALRHPLRPFLRWHFHRQLQAQCAQAMAGCYVTDQALQRRYPVGTGAISMAASDVDLPDEAFVSQARTWTHPPVPPRLIMVGTLAQLYKAPDVLLRAVALCHQRGFPVVLNLVGDGAYRGELTQLAVDLGIHEHVRFLGHVLSGPAVRTLLDQADAFILPSRQEGLPRAMVEAMARALPCLGSTVGGIPELLDSNALVAVGDHQVLAQAIQTRLGDAAWMSAASARNLERAKAYHETILVARRTAFYQAVRDGTADWLRRR